jgi:E3 ubiquitin-protein ligase synoviolin
MFYGMPIHIIRDVALTIRSFYKRITDFVRYRQATRDMNARYPDATAAEVAREDVCIICREEMRPWLQQPTPLRQQEDIGAANATAPMVVDERLRPKKLPCGHILHFACLRSWLERQQNCPTCRRPVLVTGTVTRTQERGIANQDVRVHGHPNQPQAYVAPQGNVRQPIIAPNVFNFGPFRIAFGARQGVQGPPQQINTDPPPNQQGSVPATQIRMANAFAPQRQLTGMGNRMVASFSPSNLQTQLHQIEQHLLREINGLRIQQNQLNLVRALQGELARLRTIQANTELSLGTPSVAANQVGSMDGLPPIPQIGQSFGLNPQQQTMGHGHSNLPTGMTLPLGWTVMPLQRLPDQTNARSYDINNAGTSIAQSPAQGVVPSAAPLPSDAAASTMASAPDHETPSMSPLGGSGNATATNQATRQPSPSSPKSGITSTPQNSVTNGGEGSKANFQSQSANSEATSSDIRQQPDVPDWGSISQRSNADQNHRNPIGNSKSVGLIEDRAVTSAANSRQSKGKGKASTVEDSTEDVD